jgi:hypothetical protein
MSVGEENMRYRMDNGTIVDTARASRHWEEACDWDGSNMISRATGSQWEHRDLYRSRRGNYYVRHYSDWQGTRDHIEWVSREEAARWLLLMEEELPKDLKDLEDEIVE